MSSEIFPCHTPLSLTVVFGLGGSSMRTSLPCSMWDLSSPTRDWTHIPCIGRSILNHLITRQVLSTQWFLNCAWWKFKVCLRQKGAALFCEVCCTHPRFHRSSFTDVSFTTYPSPSWDLLHGKGSVAKNCKERNYNEIKGKKKGTIRWGIWLLSHSSPLPSQNPMMLMCC